VFNRLKNLFGSKSESPSEQSEGNSFDLASSELTAVIIKIIQDERGVHAETAITAAGSLAGFCLLKQTGIDVSKLTPGSAVFTDGVNELGPQMVGLMSTVCVKLGLNGQSGWGNPIPEDNKSLRPEIELVRQIHPAFKGIITKFRIPVEAEAMIAAIAAIKFVKMANGSLNTEIGKAIALKAMVAASKTVPFPN
jgi:hypothetical protein